MKRIIIIIVTLLIILPDQFRAQSLNGFFAKYGSDKQFESVSVGRFLFSLALIAGDLEPGEKELIAGLRKIKVLTSKDDFQPQFASEVMQDLNKVIRKRNFENLIEVREKSERVSIYVRKSKNYYTDLLIAVRDSNEVNVIWINGKLTQNIIEKIQNKSDNNEIKGLPVNINI